MVGEVLSEAGGESIPPEGGSNIPIRNCEESRESASLSLYLSRSAHTNSIAHGILDLHHRPHRINIVVAE